MTPRETIHSRLAEADALARRAAVFERAAQRGGEFATLAAVEADRLRAQQLAVNTVEVAS